MRLRPTVLLALLGSLTACASSGAGSPEPVDPNAPPAVRGDSHTITEADLAPGGSRNLLDAVRALRPRWLQANGNAFSSVTVFVGESKSGGPGALSSLLTTAVHEVRYYEASAAQQRFAGVSGPVIQVVLRQGGS